MTRLVGSTACAAGHAALDYGYRIGYAVEVGSGGSTAGVTVAAGSVGDGEPGAGVPAGGAVGGTVSGRCVGAAVGVGLAGTGVAVIRVVARIGAGWAPGVAVA